MDYVTTGSLTPEPPLMYIRGLLAQLAAFDFAVGPESNLLTGHCSTLCMLDADPWGVRARLLPQHRLKCAESSKRWLLAHRMYCLATLLPCSPDAVVEG